MKTLSQARSDIWSLIEDRGVATVAAEIGVTVSMLYKLKHEKAKLGRKSAAGLRALFGDRVDDATWLAAMGVGNEEEAAEAAP